MTVELNTRSASVKTAYEANADTNAFTDAEKTKLGGIEASADVTDTANVTAAGALMDSEVTNLAAVKAFDPTDYATAAQGATADTALQPADIDTLAKVNALIADATLGDAGDFATAAQGALADSALQSTDIDTLAELNAIIGDATLGDASDFATAAQGTTADSALQDVVDDTTPQLGGALDGQGNDVNNLGVVFLTEQAAAEADVAGKGQIWVKTATPNELWFTDDAGTDHQLGVSGGSTSAADLTWASGTQSEVSDGASAVAFDFDTDNALSTTGAKLASWKNNAVEKLAITKDGHIDHPSWSINESAGSGKMGLYSAAEIDLRPANTTNAGKLTVRMNGSDTIFEKNSINAFIVQNLGTGNLLLRAGGDVVMDTLPTSDPGVAGALWNNSNVLNVSAG